MGDNLLASIITGPNVGKSGRVVSRPDSKSVGVLVGQRTHYTDRSKVFIHSETNIEEQVNRFRRIYRNSLMSQVEERVKSNGKPGRASDPFGAATRQKAMAQAIASADPIVELAYKAYADHWSVMGKNKGASLPDKTPMEKLGHRLMIAAGSESKRLRKLYEKYGKPVEEDTGKAWKDDGEPEEASPPPVVTDSISGVDVAVGRLKVAVGLASAPCLHVPPIECLSAIMGLDPADVHQAMSRLGKEGYRAVNVVGGWHLCPPEPPKSKMTKAAEKVLDLAEDAPVEQRVALVRDLFDSLVESIS